MDDAHGIPIPGQSQPGDAARADNASYQPEPGLAAVRFEELVFGQDPNEVFLLLDYIPGRGMLNDKVLAKTREPVTADRPP